MDHELLRVKPPTHHLAVCILGAVALGTALTGCSGTTGSTSATASATPSPRVSAPVLPPLPTVPQNTVLVRETHGAGQYSFRSHALSSRALTVQFACAAVGKSAVTVQLFQTRVKPIYQISHQPCDGTVQKISLTPDTTAPIRAVVSAPSGTKDGILITPR